MPGFDGTGPLGLGPLTGGGRGYCAIPVRRGFYPSIAYGYRSLFYPSVWPATWSLYRGWYPFALPYRRGMFARRGRGFRGRFWWYW